MKTESAESENSVFQGVDGAWVEKDCTGKRKEENSVPKEYDYHERCGKFSPSMFKMIALNRKSHFQLSFSQRTLFSNVLYALGTCRPIIIVHF